MKHLQTEDASICACHWLWFEIQVSLHTYCDIYHSHWTRNNKKPIVLFTGAEEQSCVDTYRPALNTPTLSREEILGGKDIIMIQTGSLKFTDPKRRDLPICETPISGEVERMRKKERKHVFVCVCPCLSLYVCLKHSNSLHFGWMEACCRWGLGMEGWKRRRSSSTLDETES